MATYSELWDLQTDSDLRNKIIVAVAEAARIISAGEDVGAPWEVGNEVNRKTWAKGALMDPEEVGSDFVLAVLVKNKAASVAAIQGATDATIQTNVNEMVDLFAQG